MATNIMYAPLHAAANTTYDIATAIRRLANQADYAAENGNDALCVDIVAMIYGLLDCMPTRHNP